MTYYGSREGVQGIRDSSAVQGPLEAKSLRQRAITMFRGKGSLVVQQRDAGGNPQGFWPAALRGRLLPDVPTNTAREGKRRSSAPSMPVEPRTVAAPQRFLAEPHAGEYDPPESSDVLYFDGGLAGGPNALPAWAQRFQNVRASHRYNESWATAYSYGAQATYSGPEGTLVLFPLHMPRRMGSHNAIGRSVLNRPSVARTGIPGITVVQASGQYP